jgi:hypothetical protein
LPLLKSIAECRLPDPKEPLLLYGRGFIWEGGSPTLRRKEGKSPLLTSVAHICGKIVKARKDADFSGKTFPVEHSCGTIINRN